MRNGIYVLTLDFETFQDSKIGNNVQDFMHEHSDINDFFSMISDFMD